MSPQALSPLASKRSLSRTCLKGDVSAPTGDAVCVSPSDLPVAASLKMPPRFLPRLFVIRSQVRAASDELRTRCIASGSLQYNDVNIQSTLLGNSWRIGVLTTEGLV